MIIEYWQGIIFSAPDSPVPVTNGIDLYRLTFVAWSPVDPYIRQKEVVSPKFQISQEESVFYENFHVFLAVRVLYLWRISMHARQKCQLRISEDWNSIYLPVTVL